MELPTNWNDPSLLNHEPLLTYSSIYTGCGSRRGGERKLVVDRVVEAIQGSSQTLAIVQAWLDLAFPPESHGADAQSPSAHDPRMQAVFSEYYCRLGASDSPDEYLTRKRREFLSTQNVRVSGRDGLSTGARGQRVNVGRGRGVNIQDRGRGVNVGSGRGSGRGRKGQERSNLERLRVAETSGGCPRRSKVRESDGSPVAKRTHKSAGDTQVTNDLPNALQFLSQDDRLGASRTDQGCSNRKRPRVTKKSQEHPRKSELRAPDEAPAAKRTCKSSGDSSSHLANGLPNYMQLPGRVDSDLQFNDPGHFLVPSPGSAVATALSQSTVPSLSVRLISDANHPEKRGREGSGLQFNDSGPFLVSPSELVVETTLPQSVRSVRPLPRRVSTKRILPMHAEQINRAEEPSVHALDQEDVDCILKDVSSNTSLPHVQPISGPLENWFQTQDNDQDDVDVDEIENEFDAPSTNDAPLQVSSYEGAVEGSAPMIQPRRPPLPVMPPIWAQTRQEVCESFDYFRSYQSGVYSTKDIVKGYLLGGSPASRDICHDEGRLIVSHGGGKSESILDCRIGPSRFQQAEDQEVTDKSVRALLKSYRDRRPLVLLVDEKYALFPFDLGTSGYTYVVLGFYWISHAWAEYQLASNGSRRVVRWKFAFRWCGPDDPWWTAPKKEGILLDALRDRQSSNEEQNSSAPDDITAITCNVCSKKSHVIYSQGWMCLNPSCSSFWSLGGREPDQLEYDATFLRPIAAEFRGLPDLRPGKLVKTIDYVTTSYAFRKGWYCEKCGRLSCRFKWEHWECSNCHSSYKVPGRLRLAKEFWHQRPSTEFFRSHIGKNSEITTGLLQPLEFGDGRGFTNYLTFVLPHQRGKIHLILGTPLANKQADDIFQQYQEQADKGELLLRRYPLRTTRVRGTFLTNYFSQNSGEPYQYVGGTGNTVPFDRAPSSVCGALALIKERSRLALRRDIPFNEILSAAYMERQKMSFHSDSEPGLGPVVASLSLGSAAFMHFRPRISSRTASNEARNQSSIALTLILRHGDVLIMEGDGVQKHYEHTVIPMNFRIAATARCIGTA